MSVDTTQRTWVGRFINNFTSEIVSWSLYSVLWCSCCRSARCFFLSSWRQQSSNFCTFEEASADCIWCSSAACCLYNGGKVASSKCHSDAHQACSCTAPASIVIVIIQGDGWCIGPSSTNIHKFLYPELIHRVFLVECGLGAWSFHRSSQSEWRWLLQTLPSICRLGKILPSHDLGISKAVLDQILKVIRFTPNLQQRVVMRVHSFIHAFHPLREALATNYVDVSIFDNWSIEKSTWDVDLCDFTAALVSFHCLGFEMEVIWVHIDKVVAQTHSELVAGLIRVSQFSVRWAALILRELWDPSESGTREWFSNSMTLLVGSLSPVLFQWLFCIQYQEFVSTCGACSEVVCLNLNEEQPILVH